MTIQRLDVICTGGLYEDPETGATSRHGRQKLGRLWVTRTGHVGDLGVRHAMRTCPQCGRRVPVAMSSAAEPRLPIGSGLSSGYQGGVWQRILQWADAQYPDRRVVTVDISDKRYPW